MKFKNVDQERIIREWAKSNQQENDLMIGVFTDLDGSLLDEETYSYAEARESLDYLKERKIPLIINTSKTVSEVVEIRNALKLDNPFIVENGAAICFEQRPNGLETIHQTISNQELYIHYCGLEYKIVTETARALRSKYQSNFEGFNDMSTDRVVELTGLSPENARKAKQRLCSEPLVWQDTPEKLKEFENQLLTKNLYLTRGGRFHHIIGDYSKGRAYTIVKDLLQFSQTVGIGDGKNDVSFLNEVDIAIVIPKKDGSHLEVSNNDIIIAPYASPEGFNQALLTAMRRLTNG